MTTALQIDRWLGYVAASCAALFFVMSQIHFGPEAFYTLLLIAVMVLGIYCAVRGVLTGGSASRICAGMSVLFWLWIAYSLFGALSHAKMR